MPMAADVPVGPSRWDRNSTLNVTPSDPARIHGAGRLLVPAHSAAARPTAATAMRSGSSAVARAMPAATPATHHGGAGADDDEQCDTDADEHRVE